MSQRGAMIRSALRPGPPGLSWPVMSWKRPLLVPLCPRASSVDGSPRAASSVRGGALGSMDGAVAIPRAAGAMA
eukprot:7873918-Alexandrium_andersonii.AAC.1